MEEIMAENFPKLIKHINLHIQEARHSITKLSSYSKTKTNSWKQQEESNSSHTKRASIRLTADFSLETNGGQEAVRWHIQSAKRKKSQIRILNPGKLSFKNEGGIKTFWDKQNWESLSLAQLPYMKY